MSGHAYAHSKPLLLPMSTVTKATTKEAVAPNSYQRFLDTLPEAALVVSPQGRILQSNARLNRMFGYAKDELVGETVNFLVKAKEDRPAGEITRLEQFIKADGELDGRRQDGTDFPMEVVSSPVPLGTVPAVVCVVRDVTEHRQALTVMQYIGEELRARNKELEQFTYLASHDLKEPLRSIASFVQLLQETLEGTIDDTTVAALTFIGEGVERMTQLVQDLLEYSREGVVGGFDTVDMNTVMAEVRSNLTALLDETGSTLHCADLPTVRARHGDMLQLMQNLVSNAAKFHAAGVAPEIRISAKAAEHEWEFVVADNGIGIPEAELSNIFRPFQRLHDRESYEGTGIGLAHCQKIIERHSGRIWVESAPGQGARFHFTIPED